MSYFSSIKQDITTSTNNSTEVNLASSATFTGTADETLGINGIQMPFWESSFSDGLTLDINTQTASVFLAYE